MSNMNERIKELKLQAQLFALEKCNGLSHDSSYVPIIDILLDNFAELIVEAICYDIMNLHGCDAERVQMAARKFGVTV